MEAFFICIHRIMFEKQLLRFGTWKHKNAPNGELNVDKSFVERLLDNFKTSPFSPILRGHPKKGKDPEENPHLIVNKNVSGLTMKDDGLYGELDIDKKEVNKYNDISLGIDMEAVDHETGEKMGPTLRHIALVVDPYIKGLNPFTALKESEGLSTINLSEITMSKDIKNEVDVEEKPTTEEAPSVEAPEVEKVEETTETEEVTVDASELQTRIVELEETIAKQNKESALKDAESKYSVLLTEGKITPAQKDAYIGLCANTNAVVELSEDKESTVGVLLEELFSNAPVVVEFGEKGVEVETADKSDKLMTELRELPAHKGKTDKEWSKWCDTNKNTIKGAA